MRVLQVAPPWFPVPPTGYGGIEWVVALLADGLVDAGCEVTLLASGGSRTRAELRTVFDEPPSANLGDPFHDVVHAAAAYRDRHRYDVVHDHSGIIGPAIGAFLADPPVVHTLHGPWTPQARLLYRSLPRDLHLVAISHDQRSRAPDGLAHAGVVPNGIPVERYPLDDRRRGDAGGYLLFLGRANPEKGLTTAITIARRTGMRLVMAVKRNEPPEHAYWREVVEPMLSELDVEVLEQVDHAHKAELLAGAEATLFPIQWDEPFGLVMTESMACGTPVLAFARGAAPEVVVDGKTGVLAAPGDLDHLVEAVGRLDRIDPVACREHVAERFSARTMVDGYLDVYRRVLGRVGA